MKKKRTEKNIVLENRPGCIEDSIPLVKEKILNSTLQTEGVCLSD